jgi:hypothetical protein
VREYLYLRKIEASPGRVTAVLGLAEIRLQEERPADAVDLLRRLERLSPEPFESLLASGRLLAEYDQPAAAREFLERRLSAVPWDGETRLELARPGIRAGDPTAARHLDAVIRSGELPYDLRTAAAREQGAIQPAPVELAGSRELDLLTGRIPMTVANAGASGFFAARLAAAEDASPELRYQLLLGALAERPDESDARKQFLSAALATTRYAESLAAYPTTVDVDFEIARSLAEASLALGRPSDAVRYFAIAIAQVDDPEARLALEAGREAAQSAYDRILEDERRRPVMREDLDQPGPVRRRLP